MYSICRVGRVCRHGGGNGSPGGGAAHYTHTHPYGRRMGSEARRADSAAEGCLAYHPVMPLNPAARPSNPIRLSISRHTFDPVPLGHPPQVLMQRNADLEREAAASSSCAASVAAAMEEPCDEAWLMEAECCSSDEHHAAMHPDRINRMQNDAAIDPPPYIPTGEHSIRRRPTWR